MDLILNVLILTTLIQMDLIQMDLILMFDSQGLWLLFDRISVDNEYFSSLASKPFRKRKDIYRR